MKKVRLNRLPLAAVVSSLLSVPVPAWADVAADMQRLDSIRQMKSYSIERRMSMLQQERACIHAARTLDALNACDRMSRQMQESLQAQPKARQEEIKSDSQQDKESK